MKIPQEVRKLIESGTPAHLVTLIEMAVRNSLLSGSGSTETTSLRRTCPKTARSRISAAIRAW